MTHFAAASDCQSEAASRRYVASRVEVQPSAKRVASSRWRKMQCSHRRGGRRVCVWRRSSAQRLRREPARLFAAYTKFREKKKKCNFGSRDRVSRGVLQASKLSPADGYRPTRLRSKRVCAGAARVKHAIETAKPQLLQSGVFARQATTKRYGNCRPTIASAQPHSIGAFRLSSTKQSLCQL